MFARAGAIIPVGPDVQYCDEKPWDDLEIRIFPGADGSFMLYEDEGDTYRYEQGACSTITFTLKGRTLTVGARQGSFPGMLQERSFRLTLPDGRAVALRYDGSAQTVKL